MRTIKHWAFAAAAAAALALAGCGGGGGGGRRLRTTPTTEPPPPSALSFATDLNGSVEALMALSGDADTEGSALMMAMKYAGMIGTESSDGNSMAAMMNAQMVLDAKQMLMDAIEAAEADLMEAKEAKAGTEDADVIEALDQAIDECRDGDRGGPGGPRRRPLWRATSIWSPAARMPTRWGHLPVHRQGCGGWPSPWRCCLRPAPTAPALGWPLAYCDPHRRYQLTP